MKPLLKIASILFTLIASSANAADYFYCDCQTGSSNQCIAGNDSNNGTSPLEPKQSIGQANAKFSSLSAGDSINFCKGGSFASNSFYRWVNKQCDKDNKCSVTSYNIPGTEDLGLPRPIITQNVSQNLFSLDDPGNSDHEEGYSFSNLDLRCNNCTGGYGFFLYNDVDHVDIENISIDGFSIGVHLSKSNPANPGSDGTLDFITLRNLSITNSESQGILGGSNTLEISNSYFENNGTRASLDHNIYISRGHNINISGNELYRSALDSNGDCTAVSLVVHGIIDNLLIENNTIREDANKTRDLCWGIAVDPGYDREESFTNVTIRNNKIIDVGKVAIEVGACDNCIIENNSIFYSEKPFKIFAIKAPNKTRNSNDRPLHKVIIRNNSIYTAAEGTGIYLGSEGSEHVIVSNAIHYTGAGYFSCLNASLSASAYTDIDNNTCFFPNSSSSVWESGSGTSPTPLEAWKAVMSFGDNSQYANPDFKNAVLPNIDLSPGSDTSSIVSSGHKTLSSLKDMRGKSRDTQPDAGAHEYGTYNPPSKTNVFIIE